MSEETILEMDHPAPTASAVDQRQPPSLAFPELLLNKIMSKIKVILIRQVLCKRVVGSWVCFFVF